MPFDPRKLRNWTFRDIEHAYSEKDTMLYALGLGCGSEPGDHADLKFVYDRGLVALPTMAVLLADYATGWRARIRPSTTARSWMASNT
jgi:hypothetical protein